MARDDGLTKWQRYRLKDVEAYRKRKREYAKTPKERAKRREYMRRWRVENSKHYLAWTRANNKQPANVRKRMAANSVRTIERHGITVRTFSIMLGHQQGRCAICLAPSPKHRKTRWLHIDHDHETKKVRGLLCSHCNGSLGWFEKHHQRILPYLATDTMW